MKFRMGQILIEVIIAGLIIIFVSLAVMQAIQTSLRSVDQTLSKTAGVFLSREVTESVRAIVKDDWHNISALATSSANTYFATTSAGAWATSTGSETVSLNNISYTRYFYVDDVERSVTTNEIVGSGGYLDSSTKKVTTEVSWTDTSGVPGFFTQVFYLSRFINDTFPQDDWVDGPKTLSVITTQTTTFETATSVDYGTVNTLKLQQE